MANLLKVDILIPSVHVFSGEAVHVGAPATEGDIGFMYQCSPLMTTLKRGPIRVKGEDGKVLTFVSDGGYLEVNGYRVVILVSRAIEISIIDRALSERRIKRDEKRIAELNDKNAVAYAYAELSWNTYLLKATDSSARPEDLR